MNQRFVAGGLAALAVFAGVFYIARDSAEQPAASVEPPAQEKPAVPDAEPPAAVAQGARGSAAQRPAPADPRLAALMVSPDNALIEFFADAEGRVIREIDNDAASPSFRKPLRDYTYAGDKVIRLVRYQYAGDQTQVVTADVVYGANGGIADYRESSRYEYAKQGTAGGQGLPR